MNSSNSNSAIGVHNGQVNGLRSRAAIFTAIFYFITVMLMLAACWLFLSNVDQLFPGEDTVCTEAMDAWRSDEPTKQFAGGFWRFPSFWRSVNLTVVSATVTTLIAAILGIPAAYALSRYKIPGRAVIDVLFSSVIVLPASSVGLCLVVMFQYGPLHDILDGWGIHVPLTVPGIVVVQLVLSLAMGMSAWRAAFALRARCPFSWSIALAQLPDCHAPERTRGHLCRVDTRMDARGCGVRRRVDFLQHVRAVQPRAFQPDHPGASSAQGRPAGRQHVGPDRIRQRRIRFRHRLRTGYDKRAVGLRAAQNRREGIHLVGEGFESCGAGFQPANPINQQPGKAAPHYGET